MIVLDTHVWIWWAGGSDRLSDAHRDAINAAATAGLGISAISCWEVAKLVEPGRIELDRPALDWLRAALALPRVRLLPLSPEIAAAACALPGLFHRDPADQVLVATARVHGARLATADRKILGYPHVETLAL